MSSMYFYVLCGWTTAASEKNPQSACPPMLPMLWLYALQQRPNTVVQRVSVSLLGHFLDAAALQHVAFSSVSGDWKDDFFISHRYMKIKLGCRF